MLDCGTYSFKLQCLIFLNGSRIDPRCRKYTAKAMGLRAINTKHWKTPYTKWMRAIWKEENEKRKRGNFFKRVPLRNFYYYVQLFFLYEKIYSFFSLTG